MKNCFRQKIIFKNRKKHRDKNGILLYNDTINFREVRSCGISRKFKRLSPISKGTCQKISRSGNWETSRTIPHTIFTESFKPLSEIRSAFISGKEESPNQKTIYYIPIKKFWRSHWIAISNPKIRLPELLKSCMG